MIIYIAFLIKNCLVSFSNFLCVKCYFWHKSRLRFKVFVSIPMIRARETTHHTVTRSLWSSLTTCGLFASQKQKFCLLTHPVRWKCASSLKKQYRLDVDFSGRFDMLPYNCANHTLKVLGPQQFNMDENGGQGVKFDEYCCRVVEEQRGYDN